MGAGWLWLGPLEGRRLVPEGVCPACLVSPFQGRRMLQKAFDVGKLCKLIKKSITVRF